MSPAIFSAAADSWAVPSQAGMLHWTMVTFFAPSFTASAPEPKYQPTATDVTGKETGLVSSCGIRPRPPVKVSLAVLTVEKKPGKTSVPPTIATSLDRTAAAAQVAATLAWSWSSHWLATSGCPLMPPVELM